MRSGKLSRKAAGRLQDEICHQMLRLEAGRPAAPLLLAVALLHAWTLLEREPVECEPRQWLRRLTPVCLRMIEEESPPDCGICEQESLASTRQPLSKSRKMR